MSFVYFCHCKDAKAAHHGGTYGCRTEDCGCLRYTPDFGLPMPEAPVMPGGESTSALLRQTQTALAASQADLTRVEQERDELKLALAAALDDRDWADRAHADDLVQRVADANDLLRAELASALAELEQLRARHG